MATVPSSKRIFGSGVVVNLKGFGYALGNRANNHKSIQMTGKI